MVLRWFKERKRKTREGPPMDRKEFFRAGFRGLAEAALELTGEAVDRFAGRRVRPPGAIDELDFLTHCTRCGRCGEACGPGSILIADGRAGLNAGTPYLDPDGHRPCFVCEDTPCIEACGDGALLPMAVGAFRMGVAQLDRATCFAWNDEACDACLRPCPLPGEAIFIDPNTDRVYIDPRACIGCGLCAYHCPTDPGSITIIPEGLARRPSGKRARGASDDQREKTD